VCGLIPYKLARRKADPTRLCKKDLDEMADMKAKIFSGALSGGMR
jgi:hypothetical protein